MKYLRKFNTAAEYEAYEAGGDLAMPNVSLIADSNEVRYKKLEIDYFSVLQGDGSAYLIIDYYLSNYDRIEVSRAGSAANSLTLGAKSSKMMCVMAVTQEYKGYFTWRTTASHFLDIESAGSAIPYVLGMVNDGGVYKEKLKQGNRSHILYTHDTPPEEVVSDLKLRVFASTLQDSNDLDNRIFSGRIWYVKIIDSRTEKVKVHLVPAMNNGVAGMYDMVNGRFYTNVNSVGSFTAYND